MPAQIPRCMPMEITRKWRALAEKRRAHLVELYDSGRWRHYYTEEQLVARTRDAIRLVEAWDRLCTPPPLISRRAIAAE
jgi:uncharacterized repeat protein (TIGR03809 family)